MTIHFEAHGAVAVITIDRPDVRNAVDGPHAAELADSFRRFEEDEDLSVAVLTGADGTFCAGADLKGVADGRGNRVTVDGDGPMGPSRMLLDKPQPDGAGRVEGSGTYQLDQRAFTFDIRSNNVQLLGLTVW